MLRAQLVSALRPTLGPPAVRPPADPNPFVVALQVAWDPETNTITPDSALPAWVFTDKLVVKPDQLIKRRGKAGLLYVALLLSLLVSTSLTGDSF